MRLVIHTKTGKIISPLFDNSKEDYQILRRLQQSIPKTGLLTRYLNISIDSWSVLVLKKDFVALEIQ